MDFLNKIGRPRVKTIIRRGLIVFGAIVLATVGIGATDKLQGSLVGTFLNDVEDIRCPNGMTFVNSADGFCIDRYEASVGEGCLFINPANTSDTQVNIDSSDCVPQSKPSKMPWRYISHNQAILACAKAGKHLATNSEWYAAALGTPDSLVGPEQGLGVCNIDGVADELAATGVAEGCKSSAGAYDMVGNAWEWVDAIVVDGELDGRKLPAQGYVSAVDSSGVPLVTDPNSPQTSFYKDKFWLVTEGAQGVIRGGSFGNGEDAGIYALYAASPPTFAGTAVGFRCAL